MPTTGAEAGAELATERLILRPPRREDLPHILELAGEAAVARETRHIPHPLTEEHVAAWLESLGRAGGECAFAALRKADGRFLGVVGLTGVAGDGEAELGYWIGRPYWGRGYASEAVRRLLRFAFGDLGLARIEARVFPGNARSARVLEKSGFEATGLARCAAPARGGTREEIVYAATRAGFARAALSAAVGRE